MADYDIGYGKPPKRSRFEPGKSGNLNGRPKRTSDPLGEVVEDVLDSAVKYRENGRTKTASRTELRLKMLLERAVKGDTKAADTLIEERKHALKNGEAGAPQLIVTDWLSDFDGQTAEQKNARVMAPASADPVQRGREPGRAEKPANGQESDQSEGA